MNTCRWTGLGLVPTMIMFLLPAGVSIGQERGERRRGRHGTEQGAGEDFLTAPPAYRGNVILGRPTDRSITLSVLLHEDARIRVAYGKEAGGAILRTDAFRLRAGEPREIALDSLEPDAVYAYQVLDAATGEPLLHERGTASFHTCRTPGSSFTFTVQADSHLDASCVPDLYGRCLANVLADKPDFHLDLGDTFMTGKHESRITASRQYAAQRYYFGLIGHAVPVFLVIGNHDGEETMRPGADGPDGLAVWSCAQRKRFFPNPVPEVFYTGNAEHHPDAGPLQNYYAWTWGDALFVVLDPYWSSRSTYGGSEPWNMTIGRRQYDWLTRTLLASQAGFKFVFIHQLTGGLDASGRGGIEAASLYEWGGHEKDGEDTFAANRPGWRKPIHALLVDSGVAAVFHGHDHFFARQELDGVVYQLVPQPCHRDSQRHHAEEYGYKRGDFLPASGHLRVRVSPGQAAVDYVRAATPAMERRGTRNGEVAFTYRIAAR